MSVDFRINKNGSRENQRARHWHVFSPAAVEIEKTRIELERGEEESERVVSNGDSTGGNANDCTTCHSRSNERHRCRAHAFGHAWVMQANTRLVRLSDKERERNSISSSHSFLNPARYSACERTINWSCPNQIRDDVRYHKNTRLFIGHLRRSRHSLTVREKKSMKFNPCQISLRLQFYLRDQQWKRSHNEFTRESMRVSMKEDSPRFEPCPVSSLDRASFVF